MEATDLLERNKTIQKSDYRNAHKSYYLTQTTKHNSHHLENPKPSNYGDYTYAFENRYNKSALDIPKGRKQYSTIEKEIKKLRNSYVRPNSRKMVSFDLDY